MWKLNDLKLKVDWELKMRTETTTTWNGPHDEIIQTRIRQATNRIHRFRFSVFVLFCSKSGMWRCATYLADVDFDPISDLAKKIERSQLFVPISENSWMVPTDPRQNGLKVINFDSNGMFSVLSAGVQIITQKHLQNNSRRHTTQHLHDACVSEYTHDN